MDWFNTTKEPPGGRAAPFLVSELSAIIGELLDDPRLQDIRVRGEVTNYKHHGRGHRYFSLSEKGGGSTAAVIKCVMWRSDAFCSTISSRSLCRVTIYGNPPPAVR